MNATFLSLFVFIACLVRFSGKSNKLFVALTSKSEIAKAHQKVFDIIAFLSESIRCYQCSSAEGNRDLDTCGAYESFDAEVNIPVDCQDYER